MSFAHRKSIRLPEYDYSQDGAYFITIVTQNRKCLFGDIVDDEMVLNTAGEMIEEVCKEIPQVIECVELDPYQIMPNHFHAIVLINKSDAVGASLPKPPEGGRGCPQSNIRPGQTRRSAPTENRISLPNLIQRFKSLTTRRYIDGVKKYHCRRFDRRLWQRNYYGHIIRNKREHHAFIDYISCNPQNWKDDEEYFS